MTNADLFRAAHSAAKACVARFPGADYRVTFAAALRDAHAAASAPVEADPNAEIIDDMEDAFSGRLTACSVGPKWITWRVMASAKQADRFAAQARRYGVEGVFVRGLTVGCLAA